MNDVTRDGHADTVARDVEMFRAKDAETGLELNVHKYELIGANSNRPMLHL